jgi:hypothetical protein
MFTEKLGRGEDVSAEECKFKCLKKCSYKYCINDRLMNACLGNVDEGLVFSGSNTYKMKEILPVKEIFRRFVKEAEALYREK